MLICPNCGEPLVQKQSAFRCVHGHSYDIARSGYCNLLQSSRSGDRTGDSKEMVVARRRFLDRGYYTGLADALCRQTDRLTKGNLAVHFVDAGCGEGYYTRRMAGTLQESGRLSAAVGIDISKAATQYAAKRDKNTQYITGSVFHMPLEAHCADFICSIFAPTPAQEFHRVVKADGCVLCVVPGEEHLWELKCAVYDIPYKNREEKHHMDGFQLVKKQKVIYSVYIDNPEDIRTLFAMTPYAHRTPKRGMERLQALQELEVTLSFLLLAFQPEENDKNAFPT
ncbi:MAG: methyltransferase domain-containing protein [Eubacteriales bacterium]|nr:methyltransferase domain-containing protein [Eubacteriales bacterium]